MSLVILKYLELKMLRSLFEHFIFGLRGFAAGIAYTTIAQVLPLELERPLLSLIFWSVSLIDLVRIGYCFNLSFSKTLIKTFGRLNSVFMMFSLLAIDLLLFEVIKTCPSDELFIGFSLFSRLREGLASSYVICTLMAMISGRRTMAPTLSKMSSLAC